MELLSKLFLLPLQVILGITCLAVYILVSILNIFHVLYFDCNSGRVFEMYWNVIISVIIIAVTFLILLAGIAIEVFLEYATRKIGRRIVIKCKINILQPL